ncbi:hypothetical protein AAFF_G00163730 [Aldrovandia affinis]|uniref:Uncharacterized protein n=1 Tax=Aldrovandia affinis TaxID=143900 RepID=A0AAD7SZK0_9TELE|nr:hypothetical protein AAFF_G00163730 [Aldrovandia affinis]
MGRREGQVDRRDKERAYRRSGREHVCVQQETACELWDRKANGKRPLSPSSEQIARTAASRRGLRPSCDVPIWRFSPWLHALPENNKRQRLKQASGAPIIPAVRRVGGSPGDGVYRQRPPTPSKALTPPIHLGLLVVS